MVIASESKIGLRKVRGERSVLIFGISGATWSIIEPLISAGLLPNIQRLRKQGAWGALSSIKAPGDKHFRPQTAWPSLSTGCNPERHGVTRFFHTTRNLLVPCLWDFYQERNLRSGLFWWPMTWPPFPIDGFVIPAHLARDAQTWPEELSMIKALDRKQQTNFRDGKGSLALKGALQFARLIIRRLLPLRGLFPLLLKTRSILTSRNIEVRSLHLREAKLLLGIEIVSALYRKYRPHLVMFNSFLVDYASHGYWRYHEPDKFPNLNLKLLPSLSRAIVNAYRQTDTALGRIIKMLPRETLVVLVSEHGMSPELTSHEVGRWRYSINGNEIKRRLGLKDCIIPVPIARWIAFRRADGGALKTEIGHCLSEIKVVESGKALFNVHWNGPNEVIIKFDLRQNVPVYNEKDLSELHVCINGQELPFCTLARKIGPLRSAMHDKKGIFVLSGPGIRKNAQIKNVHITDIVPTLLHATDMKVDCQFDGTIQNVFI